MSLVNGEYIELLKAKAAELKAQLAASTKREEILREGLEIIANSPKFSEDTALKRTIATLQKISAKVLRQADEVR